MSNATKPAASCIVVHVAASGSNSVATVRVNGFDGATFTHSDRSEAVRCALQNWANKGRGSVARTASGWEFRGEFIGFTPIAIDVIG